LAVLRRLDGGRKGIILRFLYETDLIKKQKPIVDEPDRFQGQEAIVALGYGGSEGGKQRGADLTETDLDNVNLREADLQGTVLRGAHLQFADLWGANLIETDLTGADLSNSMLYGATFDGAVLINANLRGAEVQMEQLNNCQLAGAIMPDGSKSPEPKLVEVQLSEQKAKGKAGKSN